MYSWSKRPIGLFPRWRSRYPAGNSRTDSAASALAKTRCNGGSRLSCSKYQSAFSASKSLIAAFEIPEEVACVRWRYARFEDAPCPVQLDKPRLLRDVQRVRGGCNALHMAAILVKCLQPHSKRTQLFRRRTMHRLASKQGNGKSKERSPVAVHGREHFLSREITACLPDCLSLKLFKARRTRRRGPSPFRRPRPRLRRAAEHRRPPDRTRLS